LIKDVWGHLPPHVREAMLNSMSEKYLPKYEELVKKYYEALAQKTKTENRKKTGK
jgi:aspartate aminotransferase-like enzyme